MSNNLNIMCTKKAAEFLGIHVETLRRLARKGEIPSFRVGKDWRFFKENLLEWTESQSKAKSPKSRRRSVLIVDDNPRYCDFLSRMVEYAGFIARYATDGESGLGAVARQRPDLILLDMVMPEMNGPQFLSRLRESEPTLPVVIVTGYPHSELVSQAMEFAPIMLLAKPVERKLLERTLFGMTGESLLDSDRKEAI